MASSDELRDRLDNDEESDDAKHERERAAIDAREHEEQYNSDHDEAAAEADQAEQAIDNPDG